MVTPSLKRLQSRTVIYRIAKSKSFTRGRATSINRKPLPYNRFSIRVAPSQPDQEGLQVALDGKTRPRSQSAGQKAIHLVSAFAHDLGLTLGPVKTTAKSNEVTAITAWLAALWLEGCLWTIDARGCQKAIAAQIIRQESDYALQAKNNQPTLATAIAGMFDAAEKLVYQGRAAEAARTAGRNGSRRSRGVSNPGTASSPAICAE